MGGGAVEKGEREGRRGAVERVRENGDKERSKKSRRREGVTHNYNLDNYTSLRAEGGEGEKGKRLNQRLNHS